MGIELDHFFILTKPGAPAADLLADIGMIEGTSNDHPGQGTSNRRFFFANAMLELLYIRDAQEAMNGPGFRLGLAERSSDHSSSPFGLVFRQTDDSSNFSFPCWQYSPGYLDDGQYFCVGKNANQIDEPICIQLPQAFTPANKSAGNDRFDRVTRLGVSYPAKRISPELAYLGQCQLLSLTPDQDSLMEIVFNDHKEQQSRDLRPFLPLKIMW